LDQIDWNQDAGKREAVKAALIPIAAAYMLKARSPSGSRCDLSRASTWATALGWSA
jgi:hypothetical protein